MLERSVQQLRALSALRRRLRSMEEPVTIAAAAARFARDVLGCTAFVIYCGDKYAADFEQLSEAPATLALPALIARTHELVVQLRDVPAARAHALFANHPAPPEAIAIALRASPTELIGLAVVLGDDLDQELLDELVFDLESALSTRLVARLRGEELAVLELQERELISLLREVEARDALIQRDLEQARRFQQEMLGVPPRVAGAAIELVYQPHGLVGGDLYAVTKDGDRLRLFVADATGHGIRASLSTMCIKSGYEAVQASAPDPAALLAALNDTIARTYRSTEMMFTAVCVDLDLSTGEAVWASGGHPDICVVRGGEAAFIEGDGSLLGVKPYLRFTNRELTIARGDGIYLYTDGYIEARADDTFFGEERFQGVVLEAHNAGRPAGAAIVAALTAFLAGAPLGDDGTFLGVRRV